MLRCSPSITLGQVEHLVAGMAFSGASGGLAHQVLFGVIHAVCPTRVGGRVGESDKNLMKPSPIHMRTWIPCPQSPCSTSPEMYRQLPPEREGTYHLPVEGSVTR